MGSQRGRLFPPLQEEKGLFLSGRPVKKPLSNNASFFILTYWKAKLTINAEYWFFGKVIQIYIERRAWFLELIGEQLRISLISVLLAGTLGLLLGIFISEHRRFAEPVMAVCNLFYTIPAIALIGLLIPLIGIGEKNAIAAIVLYGMMPMVRNTYTGLTGAETNLQSAPFGHSGIYPSLFGEPLVGLTFVQPSACRRQAIKNSSFPSSESKLSLPSMMNS